MEEALVSLLQCQTILLTHCAGCLSVTNSKPIYKLDVPMMDWPRGPFPQYLYPLEEHVKQNKQEDQKCLEEIEDTVYSCLNKYPVAAVIAEPIQSEGGEMLSSSLNV